MLRACTHCTPAALRRLAEPATALRPQPLTPALGCCYCFPCFPSSPPTRGRTLALPRAALPLGLTLLTSRNSPLKSSSEYTGIAPLLLLESLAGTPTAFAKARSYLPTCPKKPEAMKKRCPPKRQEAPKDTRNTMRPPGSSTQSREASRPATTRAMQIMGMSSTRSSSPAVPFSCMSSFCSSRFQTRRWSICATSTATCDPMGESGARKEPRRW
mmetsp:Transcript_18159/g.55512  ORF Transcript_18159/g.55512 Transcript_18159/m.55512 type:complete len:214 (+) Transcript_18159:212-853(+)